MRNTRRGEFRLTSALSARAVEIASEICRANHLLSGLRAREGRANHLLSGLRAREGRGEPLNSAGAVEMGF